MVPSKDDLQICEAFHMSKKTEQKQNKKLKTNKQITPSPNQKKMKKEEMNKFVTILNHLV